ncbi:MAG: hypothetical protein AMXMBFR55_28070 [Gemmatimonadota bacterium]
MTRFTPFGALHLTSVVALAGVVAALCAIGAHLRETRARRRYERLIALLVASLWVAYQGYDHIVHGFDVRWSLPLQLCDCSALIAALAFAWPQRLLHALAWFWGLALASQAVLTPDLQGGPSTLAFWAFWLYHTFVIGAGVYAVVVRRFRPAWPDLRLAIVLGLAYAVTMFIVDAAFGLNYGYLGRDMPGQPSLLDVLGAWPWRALWMVLLASLAMTLLWLPWAVARRVAPRRADT